MLMKDKNGYVTLSTISQGNQKKWRRTDVRKFLSVFLALFVIWLSLTGFSVQEWSLGIAVSAILALLISSRSGFEIHLKDLKSMIKFLVFYFPLFLGKLIQSNLAMAKLVLSPDLPVNPAFVRIPIAPQSQLSKFILANSITLTPGTIALEVEEDHLLIHWAQVKGETQEEHYEEIAGPFERSLRGVFRG